MASKLSRSEQSKKEDDHGLRIVLVGKTGVGKSASGNTILGREAFESKMCFSHVTEKCSKKDGQLGTQYVSIVDTPGLFGDMEKEEALNELKRCISMSSPGPHVFLIVIQVGLFTPEEKDPVNMIQMTFGKQADCYTMVLFTRGDDLEADGNKIEEMISGQEDLKTLVEQCNGRYHVFNNRAKSPYSQVTELLRKINQMVMKNGGSNYTNQMFQEAETAITEEKRKVLQNEPGLSEKEARKRAEKDNSFIRKTKFGVLGGAIGCAVGGVIGGVIGALGGFFGAAAAGAAAGGAGGEKTNVKQVIYDGLFTRLS